MALRGRGNEAAISGYPSLAALTLDRCELERDFLSPKPAFSGPLSRKRGTDMGRFPIAARFPSAK